MRNKTFDYIIAGGGTAGCVLAARLTEDASRTVLLLEAGGRNRNPFIRVPMACTKIFNNPNYCTEYPNEDELELPNRTLVVPRGRGLGGSSIVNGMLYVRGHPGDYDEWHRFGCEGWSFEDVLPSFKRIERFPAGDPTLRGHDGAIDIRQFRSDPLSKTFIDAVGEAGFPLVDDYNASGAEGASWTQHNVSPNTGRRCSALSAYLEPVLSRPNLTVVTGSTVTRVVIRDGAAEGVEYLRGTTLENCTAKNEVILCAGSICTPQLLMLSGLGPADALRQHDIDTNVDLTGVGENLQDHFGAYVQNACTSPITFINHLGLKGQVRGAFQYFLKADGPWSHWPTQAMAFLKTEPHLDRPDVQFLFAPILRQPGGSSMTTAKQSHGYCVSWCQLRPESTGTVKLRSGNPLDLPLIRHNYLVDEADRAFHRRALRLSRVIHSQAAFDNYRGRELQPSDECQSDAEIDTYIRRIGHTHFHPTGTAKMGKDTRAVVDSDLKVYGVKRLRVADASVMPRIVGANTHAASLMIGEMAALKLGL
jgi:choline dehydrogenase